MSRLRIYAQAFRDGTPSQDEYLSRLLKLLPSESVALFTLGAALFKDFRGQLVSLVVGLLVLLAIRVRSTRSAMTGRPQWMAVAVSVISYLVWIVVLGGPVAMRITDDPRYAVLFMAAWTTLVPTFYKGDNQA